MNNPHQVILADFAEPPMPVKVICPHCHRRFDVNPGEILAATRNPSVSRNNGKLGGRPKGSKDKQPRTREKK